jgi:hypothetical protein
MGVYVILFLEKLLGMTNLARVFSWHLHMKWGVYDVDTIGSAQWGADPQRPFCMWSCWFSLTHVHASSTFGLPRIAWAYPRNIKVRGGGREVNFWHKRPPTPMNCQKLPPAKIFVKKDHLWVAARLGRWHVLPAAWAKAGRHMPPAPMPACLLTGDIVDHRYLWWALPPEPMPACWRGTCRLSQCRHPTVPCRTDIPDRCTDFNVLKVMGADFHAQECTPLTCIYSVLIEILSGKLSLCVLLSGIFVCSFLTVNRPPTINSIA